MMNRCCKLLQLLKGKTLVTAESITGGGIGAALTAVPGSSAVYKGGVISYCDDIKHSVLGVDRQLLQEVGAVSAPVARQMAAGVRSLMAADVAVSVTGLAGPDGDSYGNEVGTVFIGYADVNGSDAFRFCFTGDRESVRRQTVDAAVDLLIQKIQNT